MWSAAPKRRVKAMASRQPLAQVPPSLYDGLPHYPRAEMRWGNDKGWMSGSHALINRGSAIGTAIVFLHGFGGSATGTWEQFPTLLATLPEAANTDVFFLGY